MPAWPKVATSIGAVLKIWRKKINDVLQFTSISATIFFLVPHIHSICSHLPSIHVLVIRGALGTLGLYWGEVEFRRVRGNLIKTYKTLRGLDKVDMEKIFSN
eukprot:g39879.t1